MVFASILDAPAPPVATTDSLHVYAVVMAVCAAILVLQGVTMLIVDRRGLSRFNGMPRRLAGASLALSVVAVLAAQRSWAAAGDLATSRPSEGLLGRQYGDWENALSGATALSGTACLVLCLVTVALLVLGIREIVAFSRDRSYSRAKAAA
jgi:hypothetical protein